ncbi:CBS domain-containing protein [Parvibium lacunae]|uniref:CBS domain-containing protein n=1 Tax=Parvibium lacunae TaxID=1888893 RepID=A0A368L6P5_9BURK|nr:CBS domain-containing protein [Parvibium lacunae]RCS59335.1 CBS domain-containing protein [Parvibium lacunae]
MQVRDILRIKGNTLFTVGPDTPLLDAVDIMAGQDIGSLVVMDKGTLAGMVTFKEIFTDLHNNKGQLSAATVAAVMDRSPLVAEVGWEVEELRRRMLERHARYLPVMDGTMLMGVISFHDVAKAVMEMQAFENKMLKSYIRDWPADSAH